ncbi:TolC family protein, partial [Myxococcota bacterium]|nr:TolC family protein [Myxococcota bacterium]
MRSITLCLIFASCGAPPQISAIIEATPPEIAAHPALQAQRARHAARIADSHAARAWPDPMISYAYAPRPIETRLGAAGHTLGLSQRVPWLSKLSAARDVSAAGAAVEAAQYGRLSRALRVEAEQIAWSRWRLRRRAEVLEAQGATLDALIKAAEAGLALGARGGAALSEAIRRRAALETRRAALVEADEALLARLEALLGGDAAAWRPPPRDLDGHAPAPSLEILLAQGADHPEIQVARAEITAAEAALRVAERRDRPDLQLGLTWTLIEGAAPPPEAGRDALAVSVALTLPVWR